MKTLKELLIELNACSEAIKWAGDSNIEEVVEQCHRGDWLLWLAAKVDIGLKPLTLAKGHCANTIRHLMKYEKSVNAVDVAIAFGEGKATRVGLDAAARTAFYAFNSSYTCAKHAARTAAYIAYCSANSAASAFSYIAYADAADVAASKKENQMQTADICRKYIGNLIINKVNELIK